jgi:LysR family nitrogen assimilation transcriptional regulator
MYDRAPFKEKSKCSMSVIQIFLKARSERTPKEGAKSSPARKERTVEARVLEFFLRVAELGSINRAAAELRLSQPSLSRWLSLLEHEVGTPLLIRTRQGIRLTDAGQLLLDRARPILRQLNLLRDEIGQKASAQVALAMPASMQRLVTAPFAEEIVRQHPHLTLRVYEGINNAIRRWMEDGLLDVAIMVGTERAPETFHGVPLIREQLILVGDRKAGMRLDVPVPISRLGIAHMILPGHPNVIRAHVENTLRRGGHSYRNRIEAETLTLCLDLARRGLGYTVMPYCALHGILDHSTELTAAPITNLNLIWALYVNRAREHSVAVRALTATLRKFVAAQIATGGWRFAEMLKQPGARQSVPRTRNGAAH